MMRRRFGIRWPFCWKRASSASKASHRLANFSPRFPRWRLVACLPTCGCRGWMGSTCCGTSRSVHLPWPVVVMTAHGEVPLAVRALKAGASDFIEKPFPGDALIDAVLSALQTIDQTSKQDADIAEINGRIATLTPREREVLEQLVAGQPEQDDRLQSRDEPAHRRGPPGAGHGQDAGAQPVRIGADGRDRRRAPGGLTGCGRRPSRAPFGNYHPRP